MAARLAVRRSLGRVADSGARPLLLVGLSGGADSLALAAALAAEADAAGVRAGAVIVDHGLQSGSDGIAAGAAETAAGLGLDPVVVTRVEVPAAGSGGPEGAARTARYAALAEVADAHGASTILTAHTRDDQAEQVLLALARGSGTRSLAGIPPERPLGDDAAGPLVLRPFLAEHPEITREVTEAVCAELGLAPWIDPHNSDPAYARVRARRELLPALERELGPGVVSGLARSADLAREDAAALDAWADRALAELGAAAPAREAEGDATSLVLGPDAVTVLAGLPAAVRQRVIHRIAGRSFGSGLTREHTLAIAALITDWRGQGPVFVPGIRVIRAAGTLRFESQRGSALR